MLKKRVLMMIAIALALQFSTNTFAQVTIGSGIKPNKGSILDIKQKQESGNLATAVGGLILPRVELTSRTNLFPMFKNTDVDYSGEKKVIEDKNHTGLLVYNVRISAAGEDDTFQSGLYVWTGTKWASIYPSDPSTGPTIDEGITSKVVGKSNTEYKTRKFGDAGEWMIENLRETEYDTDMAYPQIVHEKLNGESGIGEANYSYPNLTKELFVKHPEYGLLYTLVAATNGQVTQRPGYDDTSSRVQGLCPNGWVVPSRQDWRDLRKELEEHPMLYSVNEDGQQIGYTSKSPIVVEGADYSVQGASHITGFNALMVGTIRDGYTNDYGLTTSFWSSSVINDQYGYHRELQNNYQYTASDDHYNSILNLYSVRCMKRKYIEQN